MKLKAAVGILLSLALIAGIINIPIFVRADGGDFTYNVAGGMAEITGYTGAGGEITIPDKLGGFTVAVITAYAFANCRALTSVTFPPGVTEIGHGAFSGCGSLSAAYFYGNAPAMPVDDEGECDVFSQCADNFCVRYINGKTGFANPWYGYAAELFSVPATSVRLNTSVLNWTIGKSGTLTATVLPQTATDKSLSWVSNNTKIAVVTGTGKVAAVGAGTAVITCTANGGSGIKVLCAVTVVPNAPGALYLAKRTDTSVYLDWPKSQGVTGYEVYRALSSAGPYSKIKTQPGTNFIDTNQIKGKVYYYKVLAYKTAGVLQYKSALTNAVSSAGAPPLLGGVRFYASGMAESVYNAPYTPEKKDTDGNYKAVDVSLTKFYHYSEIEAILYNLGKSKSVSLYKIGTTADNRALYSLEIGTGAQTALFTANIHGNEVCNAVYLLKFAATLVNKFQAGDADTAAMLSQKKLCMVVVCNPDIFEATLWGSSVIRNKNLYIVKYAKAHSNLYSYKANANGVDLNRAFPSYAGGIIYNKVYKDITPVTAPAAKSFPGSTLGSEPETKALIKWFKAKLPAATTVTDIHSQGRMIYQGKTQISKQLNTNCFNLASKINKICGYYIIPLKGQEPGKGDGGTATDFIAELCSGFVFNTTLGRNIPVEGNIGKLINQTAVTKYNASVVTIETSVYVSPRQSGIGIQNTEWTKYKLYDTFLSICKA